MTQQNLLELAKQGDPQAIAALMNRSLQPKGIVATVERQGDRLRVLLEATQLPNRDAMTLFVKKGIMSLGIPLIRTIEIQGRQTGVNSPIWQQQVELDESAGTEMPATPTPAALPRPVAPPARPIPPPVPPLRPVSPPASLPRVTSDLDISSLDEPDAATSDTEFVPPAAQPTPQDTLTADRAAVEEMALIDSDRPVPPQFDRPAPVAEDFQASVIDNPDFQPEPTVDPPVRRSSAQSFAVPVVLLLLVGWIGAIVGYALWSALTAPPPDPAVSPTVPPPLPLPTPTPPLRSPVSQADLIDAYQSALRRGTQAERLAQSAQSVDDWSLVVSQWQQAIGLLEAIPIDSPNRGAAQARLAQYQASLAAAQQRAATLPGQSTALPAGATLTISNDISCPAIASTPESQPVELSNVQFKRDAADSIRDSIIGCITNNTNQAIVTVSVSYQGSSTDNPSLIQSGYSALGFANLAPRQTVPFRSRFEISPEVTNLNIKSIYWTPPGASAPQQTSVSIALVR